MELRTVTLYFNSLAVVAMVLLWGVSACNGTVGALLLAVWNGTLGNDVSLETKYTGILLVDYPISILVAFFYYGTNNHDEAYQLFLFDAYSTLQSAFVWLYLEAFRRGGENSWVKRPVAFGLLWQCLGGAVSLPLYYAQHLTWAFQNELPRNHDLDRTKALPIGFILGAIVPALIGMAPMWLGPGTRPAALHQTILATWQPDPIWVTWITTAAARIMAWFRRGTAATTNERTNAYAWARFSYLLAATSSTLGHVYVMIRVLTSNNPDVNFVRMYVPFMKTGPEGAFDIFVLGPWLFLQYDLIIISLSSLSWAYVLLAHLPTEKRLSNTFIGLAIAGGTLTIGPGATVSIALYCREQYLTTNKDTKGMTEKS
ncbi:Depudecin biosynthesis cluster protein 1 [Paramyrothecium foliicola]|nr:Depudecin biosynthesis cluster protein 1 [Paramyrothecium foliicola]